MGTSRERHGNKQRRLSTHLADGASSSSVLPQQHPDYPDDTLTEDPGTNVSLEEHPPGQGASARLQAEEISPPGASLPAPGATLEARGRPPTEAPKVEGEENLFLNMLPSNPARFEIMDRIPSEELPVLTLPPKEIIDGLKHCYLGHQPNGQYG